MTPHQHAKETRLYNVYFPIWLLLSFPLAWILVLPVNFLIDSLVLLLSLLILKIQNKKERYKKYILSIFGFGLLADSFGLAYFWMTVPVMGIGRTGEEPYITIPAILIAAIFIFLFNYFITFRKEEKKHRLALSLVFAIVTAPYTFFISTT